MIFCLIDDGNGFNWFKPMQRSMYGPWQPDGGYIGYTYMISEAL